MQKESSFYCFDFDGTVSSATVSSYLAREVGIEEEIETLTDITVKGFLPFSQSIRLQTKLFSTIPLVRAQEIVDQVPIAPAISDFIREYKDHCAVITGNLDGLMQPILEKLPCRFFTSKAKIENGYLKGIEILLDKGDTVRMLRDREGYKRIVAIGNGINDIPMFEAADVAISYFGVKQSNELLYPPSHYIVFNERSLCRLLKML